MLTNTRNILACAAIATAFLTAGAASASDTPLECTTDGGHNWKVEVIGPLAVSCAAGECTEVDYKVTPLKGLAPDHVAVLAEHDMDIVTPGATNVFAPCVGDTVTALGIHDCSSRAVRLNKNPDKNNAFDLVVEGAKALRGKSIVVKKGSKTERCRIASLGQDDFNINAQRTTNQELTFKGCTVSIPTDPVTGEGGEATISGPGCKFVANGSPVNTGQLIVDGKNVGALTFGDGFISSGTSSCTTKVISNRLYTWCTCADGNGDGIPDDPKPPCPLTVP